VAGAKRSPEEIGAGLAAAVADFIRLHSADRAAEGAR
jgi:hypothetical protein